RLPASISRLTWAATLRMRSTLATEVPPNFMTRKDMATRVNAPGSWSCGSAHGARSAPQETPSSADGRTLSHQGPRLQPFRTGLDSLPRPRANPCMQQAPPASTPATLDSDEIERFARLSSEWWDARGKFRALHKIGPVRLGFVRDAMVHQFDRGQAGRG